MSNSSNNRGRAYEFIWANTLFDALKQKRKVVIVDNSSYQANKRAWEAIDANLQNIYKVSAKAAVKTLLELEPRMAEPDAQDLILEFQTDEAGVQGDVRDLVIKRNNIKWEIGLSIKHNHDAVKHSRLSHVLDFGNEWFGMPCSKNYWDKVKPVFDNLIKKQREGMLWRQVPNKTVNVYVPLLEAFIEEIQRAYKKNKSVPKKMLEYLIGLYDYHKIVSNDRRRITTIETFNVHGTLNKPGKIKTSIIVVPSVKLPTELVAIRLRSNTTVEMYLNNGWQLSFRIHNAKTEVEPSLKFDIRFISMPTTVLTIECKWN